MLEKDEEQAAARWLVDQVKAEGVDLIAPGGLLNWLTNQVLETALGEELADRGVSE